MRTVWITDIHLDFLRRRRREAFFSTIMSHNPNAVFLTGDISVASSLLGHLRAMSEALNRPVYFVWGNRDLYYESIANVRAADRALRHAHPLLTYLPDAGVVPLTASTALVGYDWWGDKRYRIYPSSTVKLNGHGLIKELTKLTPSRLQQHQLHLGDEAAIYLRETLSLAFDRCSHVILLTHVPPFRQSWRYQDQGSNDEWLPFFGSPAVGDVLRELMQSRPHHHLTVCCGHIHNSGTAQILPNLEVITGAAENQTPQVNAVIEVE